MTVSKNVRRLTGVRIQDTDEPLLEHLQPPHLEILKLSAGMDMKAMQERLNVQSGTVKSRLNRARAALVLLRAEAAR